MPLTRAGLGREPRPLIVRVLPVEPGNEPDGIPAIMRIVREYECS
jgi:hypothetical protein